MGAAARPGRRDRGGSTSEPAKARIDEYFSRQSEIAETEAVAALDSDRYLQMLVTLDALIEDLTAARGEPRARNAGPRPAS